MISLQSYKDRLEIWIVLSGMVKVIKGNLSLLLKEGKFCKIDKKEKHRITGFKDSWILEVAIGQVRGHDIIRYQDKYGRVK